MRVAADGHPDGKRILLGARVDAAAVHGRGVLAALPAQDLLLGHVHDLVVGVVSSLSELEGRVTRYPILAGEQITTARLQGSTEELPGGVLGIPEGFEAISVR